MPKVAVSAEVIAQVRKKTKVKGTHPARARYWMRGTLKKHKIANIMRNTGCTATEAEDIWLNGYPSHEKTAVEHLGNITKRVELRHPSGKPVFTMPTGGRRTRYKSL